MKDCSSCKKKPVAGECYEETKCARCLPWNPTNNGKKAFHVQMRPWWWDNYDKRKAQGLDIVTHT